MMRNRKGSTGIDLILLLLVLLGGIAGTILGIDAGPAATETADQVVHTGAITAVNHRITSGMGQDVTEVEFEGGVSYTVVGYHNVAPGEICQIVRTAAGYDLQLK